ncbi:UPF0481 protein At3g47200-like [Andrographis paniculata]|uniref:UPF0481 protein At3g47200-like n=1 Tax=Andrographis paniculata TaxID=175694 RepID=UPI0021E89F64|nr:UPF0481 protein At3g47200-like [Andrographis paniculata]
MMEQKEKSARIDPSIELLKFIEEKIEILELPLEQPFIRKVPKEFLNGHAKIYEPISISIGPLYYKMEEEPAKEFKKWCLKDFIDRLKKKGSSKKELVGVILGMQQQIRECYGDLDHDMSDFMLGQIMLLDGCFIMELFRHRDLGKDMVHGSKEKVPLVTLQQDLLKIENQLPFSVLKTLANLLEKSNSGNNTTEGLIKLALGFFNIPKPKDLRTKPRHLLELVLDALFFTKIPTTHHNIPVAPASSNVGHGVEKRSSSIMEANSASILKMHGITLEASDCGNGLAMVEFKNSTGKLRIPQLVVQESTQTMFWNLLVFEMYSCPNSRIFTSYVVLMDTLIDNVEDVRVLLEAKILVSRNNDVSSLVSLFNEMSAYVSATDFYFEQQVREMSRYCRSTGPALRACSLKTYNEFRWDPLNSALIFILTITQTLFSILAYKPKGN